MTNRDHLIKSLTDAEDELILKYINKCPYPKYGSGSYCKSLMPHEVPTRAECLSCKKEWLDMEINE